tara:strand:+ start:1070 stop:1741 length:672 start_codon:yes stop_codon:yes gene_type:complete
MMRKLNNFAIIITCILFSISSAFAQNKTTLMTAASWHNKMKKLTLLIPLIEKLSDKQKDLITSGFSTFSALSVYRKANGKKELLFRNRCTVRFDTWEEIFETSLLDMNFKTVTVKKLNTLAELCLTARIPATEKISYLINNGGIVHAELQVKQIPTEESDRIRDWVIQQQSRVMQGLFSHMMGDLKYSEAINIAVQVPSAKKKNRQKKRNINIYPDYQENKSP